MYLNIVLTIGKMRVSVNSLFLLLAFQLLIPTQNLIGQTQVMVPYRSNDYFGLSDLSGKLKTKAVYNHIEPLGNGYFQYRIDNPSDNASQLDEWTANNQQSFKTGLLKNNKVIIAESEHRNFICIENKLIIGSDELNSPYNVVLYNLKGVRLHDEMFDKFRVLAKDGFETNQALDEPYITLYVQHQDRKTSLLIYDVKQQVLITPLLDRVTDFAIHRQLSSETQFVCTYYNDDYEFFKDIIRFDNKAKQHIRTTYTEDYDHYESPGREGEEYGYGSGNGPRITMEPEEAGHIPYPPSPRSELTKPKPVKPILLTRVNDISFKYEEQIIELPSGQKLLYPNRYSNQFTHPLIYTDGDRYGLITSDSIRRELQYDTLRYISYNSSFLYLVAKTGENPSALQWGVLDQKGDILIPMIYERLTPGILELTSNSSHGKGQFTLRPQHLSSTEPSQPLTFSKQLFTAQLNDKVGIINLENKILLPIENDSIWKNGIYILSAMPNDNNFYVYKHNGKMGIFQLDYHNNVQLIGPPVLPYIPVTRYSNYGGVKDLTLVQFAHEGEVFFCYGLQDGTVFYKKKQ
jgi:hypothetical protein